MDFEPFLIEEFHFSGYLSVYIIIRRVMSLFMKSIETDTAHMVFRN